jgi:hypothetical protein
MILVLHLATHLNFKHCQVHRQRPYLMICFLTMRRLVQYGFSIQYRLVQYIQINTWAFPYWPGYHPESPILARDEMPGANMGRGMITRPIWKCPCIKLFITYFRHLENVRVCIVLKTRIGRDAALSGNRSLNTVSVCELDSAWSSNELPNAVPESCSIVKRHENIGFFLSIFSNRAIRRSQPAKIQNTTW